MTDLEYIKSLFLYDFKSLPTFTTELFNCINEKIELNEKENYLKRGILYNAFKYLKNFMIISVDKISFYKNHDYIIINYTVFSLNSGLTPQQKIIQLELPY